MALLAALLFALLEGANAWASFDTLSHGGWRGSGVRTCVRLSAFSSDGTTSTTQLASDETQLSSVSLSRRQWFMATAGGTFAAAAAGLPGLAHAEDAFAAPAVISTATVCDPTISVWKRGNRLLYLLGTAHISEESANLAKNLVEEVHPNAVFVELDLKRVASDGVVPMVSDASSSGGSLPDRAILTSTNTESPTRIVIPRVRTAGSLVSAPISTSPMPEAPVMAMDDAGVPSISADPQPSSDVATAPPLKKASGPLAFLKNSATQMGAALVGKALRGMYSNLGQAGFQPGEEFAVAMRQGQAIGADIVLGDRDVQVTLQRLTQALAVTDLDALLNPDAEFEQSMKELFPSSDTINDNLVLASPDSAEEFKRELSAYVEAMKSRDRVRTIMTKLKEVAPALVQVMLTERDVYMATGLDMLNEYQVITAVMGLAHQDGVEQNLRAKGWEAVQPTCMSKV